MTSYFSYLKPVGAERQSALTVARGHFDGSAVSALKDVFSCGPGVSGPSRLAWGRDGKLYMTTPSGGNGNSSQDPSSYSGKVLRLNDDGTAPANNPCVGRAGHKPEIRTAASCGSSRPRRVRCRRPTRRARLAEKHVSARRVPRPARTRGQHFDRHRTRQIGVDGAIHDAHSAFANLVGDFPRTDAGTVMGHRGATALITSSAGRHGLVLHGMGQHVSPSA
jgi:hypothetical protein